MSDLKQELLADVTNESGLTHKEEYFLAILFEECNGNVREAMDKSGYSKNTPVSVVSRKLSKHIKELTKEYLISSTPRAAISLTGVLSDPAALGAKNIIAAARDILDRGGIFKEEAPQVTEVRNMYILPAKEQVEVKVIDHDDEEFN